MKLNLNWVILYAMFVLNCMELTKSAPTSAENNLQTEEETFLRSLAEHMKSFMNTSVDPCDNFYTYACGNYPNVIEDLETYIKRSNFIDGIFLLHDKVDAILKKVRDPSEKYYDELQIAKKFVNTCVNANLFPMKPSEEYLGVIKAIGGFPAIDPNWNESSFDWFNMTAHLTRYGVIGFVETIILQVYPFKPFYKIPKLGFGFDVYLENIATNKSDGYIYNEKIMRNLLQVYNVSGANADKVIEGVFQLWRDIIELQPTWINEDFIRDKCEKLSADENFKPSYFEKWINLISIAWDVQKFSISYESYCPCNWFYNKLDALAKKNPKPFANYMALKFLFHMHPQLKSTKFQRRQCIAIVKDAMPMIFSHFFMKEHYNKEDNYDISEIIFELKTSWKYLINTADWLDDSAHDEAFEKLKNLRWRIGQVVDPIADVYIKQIRSLNATENMAFNKLQLAKFKMNMRHYGYLHQNRDNKTEPYEILDAVKIRAFYAHLENKINVMGGIFYPPFYHKDFPISVKYGTLGYVIGHEIAHGFGGRGFVLHTIHGYRRSRMRLLKIGPAVS